MTSSFSEEDFDSDCSINSADDDNAGGEDLEEDETSDAVCESAFLLPEFEAATQTFIANEQARILQGILEMQAAAPVVEKKNELLDGVNETLSTLRNEISSLDKFITIKDRFIDKAAESSAELSKAKQDLQIQFSRHQDEIHLIKQKLDLAQSSLRFAAQDDDSPLKNQLENSRLKIREMEGKVTSFLTMLQLEQSIDKMSLENQTIDNRQRIDELRAYKDGLIQEKQIVDHLLDHQYKPEPRICSLCRGEQPIRHHILAQSGTDPMKIQQRKYELDALMETLDVAIDMKNAAILGHQWQVIIFSFFISIERFVGL